MEIFIIIVILFLGLAIYAGVQNEGDGVRSCFLPNPPKSLPEDGRTGSGFALCLIPQSHSLCPSPCASNSPV